MIRLKFMRASVCSSVKSCFTPLMLSFVFGLELPYMEAGLGPR